MNFNDLLGSYLTLFALLVVNNWYVIVQMYTEIMGSHAYRFFFLIFYYCGVTLAFNILIAFAVDICMVVERLDK
jgi:riboflavin transporter FmnP